MKLIEKSREEAGKGRFEYLQSLVEGLVAQQEDWRKQLKQQEETAGGEKLEYLQSEIQVLAAN